MFTQDGGRPQREFSFSSLVQSDEDVPPESKVIERDMVWLMAVSNMPIRVGASRYMRLFINSYID
jgi:hypothetical protein